jgi:transcription elongation factor Elf1
MPDKTVCPRCRKIGFVRLETVIKAGNAVRSFYCGACGHQWTVTEDASAPPAKGRNGRPDRSRAR